MMQSNQSSRSASADTVPDDPRSPSVELLFPDGATNKCIFKHCHVSTTASSQMASQFYMRSHMRTMVENSSTGSHPGSKSPVRHPEANPFYLMEEYCGVSLGRDVERMLAVEAEDVCIKATSTSIQLTKCRFFGEAPFSGTFIQILHQLRLHFNGELVECALGTKTHRCA